jgi:hypothetical protein
MKPIVVLNLVGDPYSRGRQFGSSRGMHIRLFLRDWLQWLGRLGVPDPQEYALGMLQATRFRQCILEHAGELLKEVNGIADGADVSRDLLLAAQLMDEEWAYRPEGLRHAEGMQKCSSVALRTRVGRTWIGQNMDLGGYTDGHQLALRISSSAYEREMLIFTIGGMIALMGVNGKGMGVCVNSLPQLPSARDGLPVAFVIRKLLQEDTVATAARLLATLPHSTGQHYLLADSAELRSFEVSSASVTEYSPADPMCILHTNHPLVGATVNTVAARYQANSLARLRSLQMRLTAEDPTLGKIKAALSSHDDVEFPICRPSPADHPQESPSATFTTGSMISELGNGKALESWMSAGPPCSRGYTRIVR